MIASQRLPVTFDAQGMLADLGRVPDDPWIAHFVPDNYVGDWHGVALRGPAGATHPVHLVLDCVVNAWVRGLFAR